MNLVFNGLLFVVSLYLQVVRGFGAVRAGVAVLPMAVPLVVLAPVSGRLTARRGPRTAVVSGCLAATVGALPLLGVGVRGGLPALLVGLGVLGCGAGLTTASVRLGASPGPLRDGPARAGGRLRPVVVHRGCARGHDDRRTSRPEEFRGSVLRLSGRSRRSR
ncbi:MAG: hypothetical protein ABR571_07395 [Jatrophihabitans sp.]|uniref:hypothetical protein n=1 Tax=Jatrophihabitans sp. TaxID=1932789 RepID=UPI00390D4BE9